MKTFVGIVTFGNLDFTKLAVKSVRETSTKPVDICIIVGKPGDNDTATYCAENNIPHIVHGVNKGFPASLNDLYDWGFGYWDYDAYIAMGNDVITYPHAIDSLISVAESSDYEWICAREYSVKDLVKDFPQTRKYFKTSSMKFTDFDKSPWMEFDKYSSEPILDAAGLSDVHNLCLYKRSVFEKIGYIDVNFYPAYYEDNDYARRAINAGLKSCTVLNSFYFHFWSRTIHQGSGGSTGSDFNKNKNFYITKWGGDFGGETYSIPFNNKPYKLTNDILLPSSLYIGDRSDEEKIIQHWRQG